MNTVEIVPAVAPPFILVQCTVRGHGRQVFGDIVNTF